MKPPASPHSRHKDDLLSVKLNGSSCRAGFVQLFDAAGREVGDILVIRNISTEQSSLRTLLAVVITLCSFIGASLVIFFYLYVTRIERRLLDAHASLATQIEKRKQTESELRRHHEHLEDLVTARTAELEDTNKQLRGFVHLAGHDLKTPLRGIGTLAQWLLQDYYDKLDDNGRQQIELLVKRVRRMDELINATLRYSTLARHKHNEHQVDHNALLEEIVAEIGPPQEVKIGIVKSLPTLTCEAEH